MNGSTKSHYEVIVIGAGVAGIYQIKLLADLGVNAESRRLSIRHNDLPSLKS